MAVDYSLMTKTELIAMLQLRDAGTADLEVIALKLERLSEKKLELTRRANEVLNFGNLSTEERNTLSAALQEKASKTQDKITELTALQAKLTAP
jgi:hypothetical protein